MKRFKIKLRVYGALNCFITPKKRYRPFCYYGKGHPSIKDTLEAVGIPHPEINVILADGRSIDFSSPTVDRTFIEVFPAHARVTTCRVHLLQPKILKFPRFICDVHLGKLSRHLRLFGFDTLYENCLSDHQIVKQADEEGRIVLSRDIGLLKHKKIESGYFIRHIYAEKQFREVVRRYELMNRFQPFGRCLDCNDKIVRIAKAKVFHQLPDIVKRVHKHFFQCQGCHHVYWRGTHFDRLNRLVAQYAKNTVSKK
ncbi:MAG: Mut7-C ubiquitin/RNAse domain-containing protein [Candidatus Omnitrophica bacterium]|nr:Mut7-C ubiquitin/RNAse domain-containing protein [Candidatus Omnitrophota bacterium]